MPNPTAIDAANKFRRDLTQQEAASAERMATIYARIYQNLRVDAAALAEQIAAMPEVDARKIIKLARVQSIIKQVEREVSRFGGVVEGEITIIQGQAIQQGIDNALSLIGASMPSGLRDILEASFTRLSAEAVENAAGFMASDSPLRQQLEKKFGEWTADQVEKHLTDGIAAGMNPRRIADQLERNLQEGLGSGLTSALSTIRTAQIKSYQLANHATYRANSHVVKGWVWYAELGPRTCLSCIAQHGTVHSLDEELNDHDNGRCAPLPQTIDYADLGLDVPESEMEIESGEDWFSQQPESVQREMMGPGKYEAWQNGEFEFDQLSRTYDSPVWGEQKREATLGELTK